MNLKIITKQVWDKAEDCNYQCGADTKAKKQECHSNHKICDLCGSHMVYTAHHSEQPNSKYAWNLDHKNPRSKGGSNKIKNLQAVHVECNKSKSDF